ncbi:hypothetical protein Hanom_Chr14g01260661 [Helianthus anomalus]
MSSSFSNPWKYNINSFYVLPTKRFQSFLISKVANETHLLIWNFSSYVLTR